MVKCELQRLVTSVFNVGRDLKNTRAWVDI